MLRCRICKKKITPFGRNGYRALVNVAGTPEMFDWNNFFSVCLLQRFIVPEIGVNTQDSGKTICKTDDRHAVMTFGRFDFTVFQSDRKCDFFAASDLTCSTYA